MDDLMMRIRIGTGSELDAVGAQLLVPRNGGVDQYVSLETDADYRERLRGIEENRRALTSLRYDAVQRPIRRAYVALVDNPPSPECRLRETTIVVRDGSEFGFRSYDAMVDIDVNGCASLKFTTTLTREALDFLHRVRALSQPVHVEAGSEFSGLSVLSSYSIKGSSAGVDWTAEIEFRRIVQVEKRQSFSAHVNVTVTKIDGPADLAAAIAQQMDELAAAIAPVDQLDVEIDGWKLRTLVAIDEEYRQDRGLSTYPPDRFTTAQRAAVSAHWSAQLRERMARKP